MMVIRGYLEPLSVVRNDAALNGIFKFFYNSLFPAKSWQDPASIDWGLNQQPPDHQSNALLTVLARNLLGRRLLK